MSHRFGPPLIAGAHVHGNSGLGVLAELVPSTGEHGPGIAYTWLGPAEAGKEVRVLITQWPEVGSLFVWEDTSFEYDGAGGTAYAQLFVEGAPVGAPQPVTFAVGAAASSITPIAGRAAATGYAPTLTQPCTIAPTKGAAQARGYAPTIEQSAAQTIAPASGRAEARGYAPALSQPITLTPAAGHAIARGYAPEISQASSIRPEAGRALASGYAPTIAQPRTIAAQTGRAQASGHAPIIVQGSPIVIDPQTGRVSARGYAPGVVQGGAVTISPASGRAAARGYAPGVTSGITPDTLPIDAYIAAYLNPPDAGQATHGHDYLRLGERFARRRGLV